MINISELIKLIELSDEETLILSCYNVVVVLYNNVVVVYRCYSLVPVSVSCSYGMATT